MPSEKIAPTTFAWETKPLGSLVDARRGISYGIVQPGRPMPSGIPVLRVNNLSEGRIRTDEVLKVGSEVEEQHARTRLRGGEVLLSVVGSIGQSAVVPEQLAGWNVARAIAVVPVRSEIGSRWVEYCLRSSPIQQHIQNWATTTVQATLNLRDVVKLPIPLPNERERERIVGILSSLDDKIELNRLQNQTLEEMARALFHSWFVAFDPVRAKAAGRQPAGMDAATAALFPDAFEETEHGTVPNGWPVRTFTETVEIIGGGTPKTSNPSYWDGVIPWFSVVDAPAEGDVFTIDTERHITEEGIENSSARILPAGTTILSARGTVGKVALAGVPMAMNQSCYAIHSAQEPSYTYFATKTLASLLQQRSHGSVFDTITRSTLASIDVVHPLPRIREQFEEAVRPLMQRILANLHENQALTKIRENLLPRLVSGELRLFESAEVVHGGK